MLRLGFAACAMAALAFAGEFTFSIGSPVAAQDFRAKVAAFVFRTQGCADPAKSQISATRIVQYKMILKSRSVSNTR